MGELRRGVLAFDIAGSIPAGSTITGVTLTHEHVHEHLLALRIGRAAQAACRLG